jgi:hypothetical protein
MGLIGRTGLVAGAALVGGSYSFLHNRDELTSSNTNARNFLIGAAAGTVGGIGANLLFSKMTSGAITGAGKGLFKFGSQSTSKAASSITKENIFGASKTAMGYMKRNIASVAGGFRNAGSVLRSGSGAERITGAIDQIGRGIWNAPITKPLAVAGIGVKGALVGYGLYKGTSFLGEHSRQNAVAEFELNSGNPIIPNPTLHRRQSMPVRRARLASFHNSTFGLSQGLHNARHRQ